MRPTLRQLAFVAVLVFLPYAGGCAGCGSSPGVHNDGGVNGDGGHNGADGGGTDGGGVDGGTNDGGIGDGGSTDGGINGRPPANPNAPGNDTRDTDCDGLSDAYEFSTVYANGKKTDPNNPDTDGDGIPDGVELGRTSSPDPKCKGIFHPDMDPSTTTSPVNPDTDGDGIPDGVEDANHNGRVDPGETDPNNIDTDGDGIPDGVEDANHNGKVDPGETNPRRIDSDCDGLTDSQEKTLGTDPTNPDTDGDGLPDGLEVGVTVNPDPVHCPNVKLDLDPSTVTNPLKADTDGDGIPDGIEDKNHNGRVDPGETNPLRIDTDCDGLTDGTEDANHNGKVDPGETDPTNPDTDGDGLPDGLEEGVTTNPDPQHCPNVTLDADPSTTTDPLNPDTDGDGLMDGVEDSNHNGRVDPGETDPNVPNTSNPVLIQACATQNLVKVLFQQANGGDIQLATTTGYTVTAPITASGQDQGVLVYDPTTHVAGLAVSLTPAGTDTTADLNNLRTILNNNGGTDTVISQPFTTWDGYAASRGTLNWNITGDIETAANTLAKALAPGATGLFTGTGGVSGPFSASLEVVRRSNQRSVYVFAFTPKTTNESPLIAADDIANGSPLAQIGDTTGVQCDSFVSKPPAPVDFLYVVDNSCSMAQEQTILGNATSTTISQLQNSSLNWRLGVIYTDYYRTPTWAGFTTSASTLKSETQPGTGGSGDERALQSTETWWNNHNADIRPGAKLVVLILSDEDEQSTGVSLSAETAFINFFQTNSISLNGLICPPGYPTLHCGANGNGPMAPTYDYVITQLSGVIGYIEDLNSIPPTISTMITATGGATSPYQLTLPPISATLKLAMDDGTGTVVVVPRSRTNGFDYDGANQTIQLYGSYRPTKTGLPMAVSYRYWEDRSPNPNGGGCGVCPSPTVCNPQTNTCECPTDCGSTKPGANYVCDTVTCAWTCPSDCGGNCTGNQTCDTSTCTCACSQNATCSPGFTFDPTSCSCQCDTASLDCGGNYTLDPNVCACVCAPNCNNNCTGNTVCNTSTCSCSGGILP